ncbi:MAG: UxaA family hydrolase [Deltaproteobacteria bacterium]|nr:UxaA family hydrolase [Deltaproteobacteria bacterium]
MLFMAYRREDGKVGVRNHLVIMSSVSCANSVVQAITRTVPKAIPVTQAYGCGYTPEDAEVSIRALSGLLNNPNVGAALIIGLGCEILKPEFLVSSVKNKPVEVLVIQESGGSKATTTKGIEIAKAFLAKLDSVKREPLPAKELILGLECGGSDSFSGITANPAVGEAADMLVKAGGSVILSETTEMIGTAHILKKRADSPELGEKIEQLVKEQEKKVCAFLGEMAGLVIAPGNMDGGLSSITEKSLGCIMKSGTTPIREVLDYAVPPSRRGLVLMDTPGYDIDSMAGMAAGGAQIILFTTGRGNPAGFPAVPVIKISSNSITYSKMPDDIDYNAGRIIDEGLTLGDAGREILDLVFEVAEGKETCAELNKSMPFNYLKQGPTF